MDAFSVRKLGLPGHPEVAMGAIATGGVRVLNASLVQTLRIPDAVIEAVAAREQRELERRERAYRGDLPPLDVRGRTVILVATASRPEPRCEPRCRPRTSSAQREWSSDDEVHALLDRIDTRPPVLRETVRRAQREPAGGCGPTSSRRQSPIRTPSEVVMTACGIGCLPR